MTRIVDWLDRIVTGWKNALAYRRLRKELRKSRVLYCDLPGTTTTK